MARTTTKQLPTALAALILSASLFQGVLAQSSPCNPHDLLNGWGGQVYTYENNELIEHTKDTTTTVVAGQTAYWVCFDTCNAAECVCDGTTGTFSNFPSEVCVASTGVSTALQCPNVTDDSAVVANVRGFDTGFLKCNSLMIQICVFGSSLSNGDSARGYICNQAIQAGTGVGWYPTVEYCGGGNPPAGTAGVVGGTCFPRDAKVETDDGGAVKMGALDLGRLVLAADSAGNPVWSRLVAFLHRDAAARMRHVVRVETAGGRQLELSAEHLVKVLRDNGPAGRGGEDIFAKDISIGDRIAVNDGNFGTDIVTAARQVPAPEKGMFAPLTEHGTLFVNDILASSFAVVKGHDAAAANWAMSPLRLLHLLNADGAPARVHPHASFLHAFLQLTGAAGTIG